jgi:hypothetical protein
MSRAKNTIKQSDISSAPIKVKYSSTYASQSLQSYGITTNRGQNIPLSASMTINNRTRMVNYRLVKQLYYQTYLTGSVIGSASYWDPSWQSTAASGSFDDTTLTFPSASGESVSFIAIPTLQFGEQISRNSFNLSSTDNTSYKIVDDGNGNIVDLFSGSLHVGNIFYAQGVVTISNKKYAGAILNNNFTITGTLPPSPTPTPSVSVSPSVTPSISISVTPSITPTISITSTPSITPTISVTPSITVSITPSVTPSITASVTPSITPSVTITPSTSVTPSISITPTPSPTYTEFTLAYSIIDGGNACVSYPTVNTSTYYAAPGSTLTTGTIIYTDSSLTTPAPDGFYSNGVDYWNTGGGSGNLQNQTAC